MTNVLSLPTIVLRLLLTLCLSVALALPAWATEQIPYEFPDYSCAWTMNSDSADVHGRAYGWVEAMLFLGWPSTPVSRRQDLMSAVIALCFAHPQWRLGPTMMTIVESEKTNHGSPSRTDKQLDVFDPAHLLNR